MYFKLHEWSEHPNDQQRFRAVLDKQGFILLSDYPVQGDSDIFQLSQRLSFVGEPVHQKLDGRKIVDVKKLDLDGIHGTIRLYGTDLAQPPHPDGGDYVALLCLNAAEIGGQTFVVDCREIVSDIRAKDLNLYNKLTALWKWDVGHRSYFGRNYIEMPIIYHELSMFYIRWYIEVCGKFSESPGNDKDLQELEMYIDNQKKIYFDLRRGDLLIISNQHMMHGRNEFSNGKTSRHLKRVWLKNSNHNLSDKERYFEERLFITASD